jgi:hypothetical protein
MRVLTTMRILIRGQGNGFKLIINNIDFIYISVDLIMNISLPRLKPNGLLRCTAPPFGGSFLKSSTFRLVAENMKQDSCAGHSKNMIFLSWSCNLL